MPDLETIGPTYSSVIIPLDSLRAQQATRPPGYYEACLAAGTVRNGRLILTPTAYRALCLRYQAAKPKGFGPSCHA